MMRLASFALSLLLALLFISDTALARSRSDRHQLRPGDRHAGQAQVVRHGRHARIHHRSRTRFAHRHRIHVARRDAFAPAEPLGYFSSGEQAGWQHASYSGFGQPWWSDRAHEPLPRRNAVRSERISVDLSGMIARHAQINGLPEALVRRVVLRESGGNPRSVGRGGAMGLMQIKTATARAMGYSGSPAGLLDAETNMTYAVRYLAGAYRVANGNFDNAVSYYARGYYGAAKARSFSPYQQPGWNAYARY
jgi:hypothetical protein